MTTRSLLARRCTAALLVASALGTGGCRGLLAPGWWPGTEDRSDPRGDGYGPAHGEPDTDALLDRRDELRARRARAWDTVATGGRPRGYGADDALALSAVEAEIDAAGPWPQRPAAGRATLADLPRRHWWYLFVEPRDWDRGPLAVDRDHAPGAYAALIAAVESIAKPAEAPALTLDAYEELHAMTTYGVFRADGDPASTGYVSTPAAFPLVSLHDPGAATVEILARSLAEMKADGLAAWSGDIQRRRGDTVAPWLRTMLETQADINPHGKPVHLVYRRERDEHGVAGHRQWLYGVSDYSAGEASRWVAQWLGEYGTERAQVARPVTAPAYADALLADAPSPDVLDTLRPICRLVRRLVVGHVFVDGDGRAATMLVLNRLLREQGLPPATVRDIGVFDGRAPVDQLAIAVFDGQKRFQGLVAELAAREPAPPQ
jgi:hypothetical protein